MFGTVLFVAFIAIVLAQAWPLLSNLLFSTGAYVGTAELSHTLTEAIAAHQHTDKSSSGDDGSRGISTSNAGGDDHSPSLDGKSGGRLETRGGRSLMIPHGGGPMPVLGEENHRELAHWLRTYPKQLPKFSAIVVISAHWEEELATVTSGANPSLIYDYYGFPEAAYKLQYPAPGSPALARRIGALLDAAGIPNRQDARRGFDHGVFIPLMLMYPEATTPVVQVSLVKGLDPDLHIRMGLALAPLLESEGEEERVLILGSGFTFRNMPAFFGPAFVRKGPNEAFEAWLRDAASSPSYKATERARRFVNWAKAPSARFCHPREEHLMPLHVCLGAGGCEQGEVVLDAQALVRTSAYLW